MKQKTNKTIMKRITIRKSGVIERTVAGHQHLRRRKSKRSLAGTKEGMTTLAPADRKPLGL